jgi:hypothetical protein
MSEVQVYRPFAVDQRRVSRALERLTADTGLTIALIEDRADIEAAVIQGIGHVGITAMSEAAVVSDIEQILALAIPHASGRLATLADLTALEMGLAIQSSARRIRGR